MAHSKQIILWFVTIGILGFSPFAVAVSPEIVTPTVGANSRGEIKFFETSRDFGVVKRGQKLVHDFNFENTGSGPLVIFGVHASCGCTVVESEIGKEYPAGAKGIVQVSFDSTNFRGSVSKLVTVMTNEKILPEHTLTMRALVQEELTVEPPLLDWSEVNLGAAPTKVLTVKTVDPHKKVTVSDLRYDRNLLRAQLTQVNPNTWEVKVSLADNVRAGRIASTMFLINDSSALKELPVPVRGFVQSPYVFTPQYLEFGAIQAQTPETRTLLVTQQNKNNLELARAELRLNNKALPEIEKLLKVSSGTAGNEMAVELSNPRGLKGSVHGRLFFKAQNGGAEEVSVDFYAFFQE